MNFEDSLSKILQKYKKRKTLIDKSTDLIIEHYNNLQKNEKINETTNKICDYNDVPNYDEYRQRIKSENLKNTKITRNNNNEICCNAFIMSCSGEKIRCHNQIQKNNLCDIHLTYQPFGIII